MLSNILIIFQIIIYFRKSKNKSFISAEIEYIKKNVVDLHNVYKVMYFSKNIIILFLFVQVSLGWERAWQWRGIPSVGWLYGWQSTSSYGQSYHCACWHKESHVLCLNKPTNYQTDCPKLKIGILAQTSSKFFNIKDITSSYLI